MRCRALKDCGITGLKNVLQRRSGLRNGITLRENYCQFKLEMIVLSVLLGNRKVTKEGRRLGAMCWSENRALIGC